MSDDTSEIELAIVTMTFDAAAGQDADSALGALLAKYVVLARMVDGCRNVDLCAAVGTGGRYLIVQKWESAEAQREHFDSAVMIDMARGCQGLLAGPPTIELWDGASAHDLR